MDAAFRTVLRVVATFVLFTPALVAHSGTPLEPHDLWTSWEFDPGVVVPLLVSALLFAVGSKRATGISGLRRSAFWGGWATLAIALVSPLHPMGQALFSAHMTQHELLMVVAAPLLVFSRPLVPFLWALPVGWRRSIGLASKVRPVQSSWRFLTRPAVAWMAHGVVLWEWHAPALFQATLTSDAVHAAQHVSFLGSALLFWWAVLDERTGVSLGMGRGMAILYIFTTAIHTTILGALLTFSPTVWYPAYTVTAPAWGLTALQDQQLGGLIMWVPAGITYVVVAGFIFAAWLRESEWRVIQAETERAACMAEK